MKSLLSWFVLIVSIAVLVSSCAKSDGVTPPVPVFAFCYSDPNNSHWYLAKTADEPGWSSGDSCYTPSGSVTPYGGQSCIGGSGLTSCISACETAGINCNSK